MNKLLLKKVEELTLYIIELQKQVNELKEKELNRHCDEERRSNPLNYTDYFTMFAMTTK